MKSAIQMHDSVGELYRIFGHYRLGDDFGGCEDCVSPTDTARLKSVTLGHLTVSDLDRYAFKAISTWGNVRHFKHFLPRLFELAVEDFLEFNFPEVLFGKLKYANWQTWPTLERMAIENFLVHFWQSQIEQPGNFPNDERIETALGALAYACETIQPFLDDWTQNGHVNALLHLAQFISVVADDIMTKHQVTNLWGNPEVASQQLLTWLNTDDVFAFLSTGRPTLTESFPHVNPQLEGIRSAFGS